MAKLITKKKAAVSSAAVRKAYKNLSDLTQNRNTKPSKESINLWMSEINTFKYLTGFELGYNRKFTKVSANVFRSKRLNKETLVVTPSLWIKHTNAIGIRVLRGRKGGVYAHPVIAMHYDHWLSPKLALIVNKTYYKLMGNTTGIATAKPSSLDHYENNDSQLVLMHNMEMRFDKKNVPEDVRKHYRADLINFINKLAFGKTAQVWQEHNPYLHAIGDNIRTNPPLSELKMVTLLNKRAAYLLTTKSKYSEILMELQMAKRSYVAEWPSVFYDNEE